MGGSCLLLAVLFLAAISGSRADVVSGDETTLFLIINEKRVSAFTVRVDEPTTYHFTNSCVSFPTDFDESLYFKVTSERPALNRTQSIYKLYYDREEGQVYNIYTVVLYANEGTVTGILFDDGCFFCGKGSCAQTSYTHENGTFSAVEDTASLSGFGCSRGMSNCDLKLTVVWGGTDGNGNKLYSAGVRFSRYASFDSKTLKESIDSL